MVADGWVGAAGVDMGGRALTYSMWGLMELAV